MVSILATVLASNVPETVVEQAVSSTSVSIVSMPFIETFLSAFLGFLSALAVEALKDHSDTKKKKAQIINNLLLELQSVQSEVQSLQETKVYPYPYSIPFWNGICMSGSILVLDSMEKYSDLVRVFAKIEEANQIESKFFEFAMNSHGTNIKAEHIDVLKKNRQDLLVEILKGINILKEVT